MASNLTGAPEVVRGMMALVAIADGTSIAAAALAGMGIADPPDFLIAEDLAAGRLVRVLESIPRVIRGIYVVYAPSPFTPTKVRRFVDALKDSFRC